MPLPPSSSQSWPAPKVILPGTLRSQRMSHSSDGSVKGKKLGRARSSIWSISKNALQNCSTVHFRWPRWMPSSTTSASTWWNMGEWVASLSTR